MKKEMMKNTTHAVLPLAIIFLSLVGIGTSVYLTVDHYSLDASFCDITEQVSCSLVNASTYSELFGIPVALLGLAWFLITLGLAWKINNKDASAPRLLLWWSALGIIAVIYLIIAEIILGAICPLCTVVHVLVVITLILAYLIYRKVPKPHPKAFRAALTRWIAAVVILNLIIVIPVYLWPERQEDHTALAQCLTENGLAMYSSFRCGVCARTKAMFGPAFQYINEVECHPQGPNSEWEQCQEKGIKGTPTWILQPDGEEVKRQVGFMSAEELAAFAGCEGLGGQ